MMAVPSKTCRALLERLSRYVDDDVSAAERRSLVAHLRRCPCCSGIAESLKHTASVCRDASSTRLPAAVRRRAKTRITALLSTESAKRPKATSGKRTGR